MITKEEALTLQRVHDAQCRTWSRNGKTQVWKTQAARFRLPVKHGLFAYGQVTERNAASYHNADTCPNLHPVRR